MKKEESENYSKISKMRKSVNYNKFFIKKFANQEVAFVIIEGLKEVESLIVFQY